MPYPLNSQTDMHGTAEFKCERLAQSICVSACLEWYVEFNALNRTESPCFKCPQGLANRENFAKS